MSYKSFTVLYVSNLGASIAFYKRLIKAPLVEESPNFALFALESGMMLGLWERAGVVPKAAGAAGATEISIAFPTNARVDDMFKAWSDTEVRILMPPETLGFGYSFVATDPDGHRIRVMAMQGME